MAGAFDMDLRRVLDDIGLWSDDPGENSRTIAAIDAAAGAAMTAWLMQLNTYAPGMDPTGRLGDFGRALSAGQLATALSGLPNALAASHGHLDFEHFERVVYLGAAGLKYVDFQLTATGVNQADEDAFDAGFRDCMIHLSEQALLRTEPPAGLAAYVEALTPETFVDALMLELQEQTEAVGMDIFS